MRPRCLIALLVCLAMARPTPVQAEEVRITLTDGSVIVGAIESMKDGVYTLRSGALGTMTVKASDVRRIEMTAESAARAGAPRRAPAPAASRDAPEPDPPAFNGRAQVEDIQRRISEDNALMGTVMGLQDDPQVQAILADPEIMEAMRAGDIAAMANNPKLRSLLDNPKVRELSNNLAR